MKVAGGVWLRQNGWDLNVMAFTIVARTAEVTFGRQADFQSVVMQELLHVWGGDWTAVLASQETLDVVI